MRFLSLRNKRHSKLFINIKRSPVIISLLIAFLTLGVFNSISFSEENPIKILYEKGVKAYAGGKYDNAIKILEKLVEIYPLSQAYYYLALSHKANGGSILTVTDLLSRAIEADPSFNSPYEMLGKIRYLMGDFETAGELTLKAIELDPNSVTARLTMGWIYLLGMSEPDLAINEFKWVTDKFKHAYAYFGLGMAYFMNDQGFMTLEMITALRGVGEEEFASHLETMVRSGRFIAPKIEGSPLIFPIEQKKNPEIDKIMEGSLPLFDKAQDYVGGEAEVRLAPEGTTILKKQDSVEINNTVPVEPTSAERIRALRKRGRELSY